MRGVQWIAAGLLIAAAAWVSFALLIDAYGTGAHPYGRTTNMDKGSGPCAVLLAVDALALAIAALVLRARRSGTDKLM